MEIEEIYEKNKPTFYYVLAMSILPILVSSYLTYLIIQNQEWVASLDQTHWTFIWMIVSLTMAFGLTPTSFTAVVAGYFGGFIMMGPYIATYAVASSIGYVMAKWLDNGNLLAKLMEIPQVNTFVEKKGRFDWHLLILTRIAPLLPFALMNVVLALLKFDYKKYLIGGCIGMIPRAFFFIWIGKNAHDLVEAIEGKEGDYTRLIFTLLIAVGSLATFGWIIKKILKEEDEPKAEVEL